MSEQSPYIQLTNAKRTSIIGSLFEGSRTHIAAEGADGLVLRGNVHRDGPSPTARRPTTQRRTLRRLIGATGVLFAVVLPGLVAVFTLVEVVGSFID
jgi:hypothetical protein